MTKQDEHHRMPLSMCINCGEKLNAAALPGGKETPAPGDLSVCLYCGHLAAYADDLTLRALTEEEVREVAGDPRILAIQRMRMFRRHDEGTG